ncbi:MAG: phosphoesterase, partial [Campylobacterota bacterium]|nr:phosphoesterase [Campylobacterota bacterium]
MNEILKKIESARHIEIVVDTEFLFVGSALYTYILTLHKKVSLVCKSSDIDYKYSFLPWFGKIKKSDTPSADLSLKLSISTQNLYNYFEKSDIKINKKMATALYGGMLDESDGFRNSKIGALFFDTTSRLIKSGADYRLCQKFIVEFTPLSLLRLKSILLHNMVLVNSAKVALFFISDEDLQSTGSNVREAQKIIKDAFGLPYVETAILLNSDMENEII